MFIIDGYVFAPLICPVIVVGRNLFQIWLKSVILNPPVKIQNLWLIPVNQLAGSYHPIRQPFLVRTHCRGSFCGNSYLL